jgi:HlyD family secretion protein
MTGGRLRVAGRTLAGRLAIAAVAIAAGALAVWFFLRPTPVAVAPATVRELTPAVHAVGTVEAKRVVHVAARIAGRIVSITVDHGDHVEPGQVLVQLDDGQLAADVRRSVAAADAVAAQLRDLEAGARAEEIAEARANVDRARAQLDDLLAGSRRQEIEEAQEKLRSATASRVLTERELARAETLGARDLIAPQEVDRARQAHDVATAQERAARQALAIVVEGPRAHVVESARAELKAARDRLALVLAGPRPHQVSALRAQASEARAALMLARERQADSVVRSPLDGYVVSRDLEPGATVNAGTPILKVADPASAWVTVHVDERETGGLRVGDGAEIVLRSRPGQPLAGRIARIRRESDRVTEQLAVDVAFTTAPERLTLGEQAEAVLRPAARRVVAVPAAALVRGPDGLAVWAVAESRLRLKAVRTGALGQDGWLEVVDGLAPGDEVVVAPGRLRAPADEGRRVARRPADS